VTLRAQRLTPRDGAAAVELQIEGPEGVQALTVLCQVPFSSDRKRMSVVCEVGGELMCITKGADSVMGPLCNGTLGDAAMRQIDMYAKLGLRTLVIGWKIIDRKFLSAWQMQMEAARGSEAEERGEKLAQCARELEHSLRLSGISAIEDRLQDGVPAAMSMLKAMSIRVWVLTGDKVETAIEIARSCSLLTDGMALIMIVNATSSSQALELLRDGQRQIEGLESCALVLDGGTMKYATDSEEGQELIFQIGMASKVCVCCRLAPQQKRRLVEIVRQRDKSRITLAIGDGANDVPMIQGAHVGIAVRGKEGNQSVQASDVAVSQFRFLVPLLQCHGRRAYRRVAVFLCYYVYKHVVLAVGDMCWAHQSSFGGEIAYPEWVSSAYAGLLTSFPVIIVLCFDRDLSDQVASMHPELYAEGQLRMHFNSRIFAVWIFSGIWHGCLAWFIPNVIMGASGPGTADAGWNEDWWIGSVVSFSLVLIFVNLRLLLIALNRLSKLTLLALITSPVLYILTLLVLGHTSLGSWLQPQIAGVPLEVVTNGKAMAALFVAPMALLLVDAAVFLALLQLRPTPLDQVRRGLENKSSRVSPPLDERTSG